MCKALFLALCMYWEHEAEGAEGAEGESGTPKAGGEHGPTGPSLGPTDRLLGAELQLPHGACSQDLCQHCGQGP